MASSLAAVRRDRSVARRPLLLAALSLTIAPTVAAQQAGTAPPGSSLRAGMTELQDWRGTESSALGAGGCQLTGSCQLPNLEGGLTSDDSLAFICRENFRVAEDGVISNVCWWGAYFDFNNFQTCNPIPEDSFTITYYTADVFGNPGPVKAGPFAVTNSRVLTGQLILAFVDEYRFEASHDPVTVQAGECCWIEIKNSLSGDSCAFVWEVSSDGNGDALQAGVGNTLQDLAFCLDVAFTADACPDCNGNGVVDGEDLANGTSQDCNDNGIPDECGDNDSDNNGVPDECELACEEFDRFLDLTANDTFTVITNNHNPQQEQGYVYAYAVNDSGQAVAFDHLVGNLLVVDGIASFDYSVNPVDYRAGDGLAEGALTDLEPDGIRDLNGAEYERTAGEILVPRFIGYDDARFVHGQLILIGLSGGARFDTTADFLVYNDNEDQFSAQRRFYCWEKLELRQISQVFESAWLAANTADNANESLGTLEYGWFRVFGDVATSTFFTINDPAVYAVYIERVGSIAAADLPFETCAQSGHLLPRALSGDNEEMDGAPSDQDCEGDIGRLRPASLLLYPEFDNRNGVATVLSITNTSVASETRVHFIYVGRFQ